MSLFLELTTILAITTIVSFIIRRLHQPLIVGYLLTGILVGPSFFNLLHSVETIELFSKLGISILLFIVGLHLSPRVIKEVGSVSIITGVGQVLFTSIIGFILASLLGLPPIAAMYVAIALTFSSTIIILKLLSDKGDVQTLYGKISIGFLLVQDVIATLILIVISSIATSQELSLSASLFLLALKGALLLGVLLLAHSYILPKVVKEAGKNGELLLLFAVTWGFGVASIFYVLGLNLEIGALIAGVTLASLPYADEMSSRLRPLRDFFIILFFVLLGATMQLGSDPAIIIPVLLLSAFVLIGNPVIVIIIMNLLGYHKKTGFKAGLTVAQISEFSLILAALGRQVGHLEPEVLTIITLVGLVTISTSTYMILYADRLYPKLSKVLTKLELKKSSKTKNSKTKVVEAYVFGFNRVGEDFVSMFQEQEYKTAVVDFDPKTEDLLPNKHVAFHYGDVSNIEFLTELVWDKTKIVISSLKDEESNSILVKHIKQHNKNIIVVVFAHHKDQALRLYETGANYVVMPHHVGAKHATQLINRVGFNADSYSRKKDIHIRELSNRIA